VHLGDSGFKTPMPDKVVYAGGCVRFIKSKKTVPIDRKKNCLGLLQNSSENVAFATRVRFLASEAKCLSLYAHTRARRRLSF
jgi:hypothetical protein